MNPKFKTALKTTIAVFLKTAGPAASFAELMRGLLTRTTKEWFATTIVATGPRIGVWVNGLQVTDWTGQQKTKRKPKARLSR